MALIQTFNITTPGVLKPFVFVVESSTFPGTPLVFECTDELLAIGMNGRKAIQMIDTNLLFDGAKNIQSSAEIQREILGISQLMELYLYYNENGFSEDKIIKEAKGMPLKLDWDRVTN